MSALFLYYLRVGFACTFCLVPLFTLVRPPDVSDISCRQVAKSSKNAVLGPRFVGGEDTPDFRHAFSNCTYFRPCGRFSLSSVQRARKVRGEKKKKEIKQRKKERRIPVKHKSADMYVARPNYAQLCTFCV